jgi:hypothetical protein
MRHVNNDPNKLLLQNVLLAQQAAEAAKTRQAERARAQAAENTEKLRQEVEAREIKKVSGNTEESKNGQKENPRDLRNWRYRPDGTIEDTGGHGEGPDPTSPSRIDIKA